MDTTHLHLLLNHFPIVGTLIGIGVMLYGYITRSEETKKAALWTWALMAIVAIPVFLTGEPAEESVENLAGVSEPMIEAHEEAAELAIWLMGALGLLSVANLLLAWFKQPAAKSAFLVSTLLSAAVFAAMTRTGYLGGQIRHSEIRTEQAVAGTETGAGGEVEDEEEDD